MSRVLDDVTARDPANEERRTDILDKSLIGNGFGWLMELEMDFEFFDPLGENPRGHRGRPPQRDYGRLTRMAQFMLEDPALTKTDAAWRVVRPKAGRRNAKPMHKCDVTRLVRKFRKHPWVYDTMRDRRERKVKTILDGSRRIALSLKFAGLRTRSEFDAAFFTQFPLCWEVCDDPRVTKAADEVWRQVRPSKLMLAAMGYSTYGPEQSVLRELVEGRSGLLRHDGYQDRARPDYFTRLVAGLA
ncbi:conserved hypothetical protein [Ricinus communis]|uniref:Uncharacterized protein n=1 Tax=Ricinus communis TaxID=3988 RepID=B9T9R4_RICCO|nr:conserved hypothetical protein [Ricinus communis]